MVAPFGGDQNWINKIKNNIINNDLLTSLKPRDTQIEKELLVILCTLSPLVSLNYRDLFVKETKDTESSLPANFPVRCPACNKGTERDEYDELKILISSFLSSSQLRHPTLVLEMITSKQEREREMITTMFRLGHIRASRSKDGVKGSSSRFLVKTLRQDTNKKNTIKLVS